MTDYYMDFNNGSDVYDGLSIGSAWRRLDKYTTVTARTAGDNLYVRANTVMNWTGGAITIDEDGNANNRISIIGCNATQGIDPWSDSSDVKPIVALSGNSYLNMTSTDLWTVMNIDFSGGGGGGRDGGLIKLTNSIGNKLINDTFHDAISGTGVGALAYTLIYANGGASLYIGSCSFYYTSGTTTSSSNYWFYISNSNIVVENCDFLISGPQYVFNTTGQTFVRNCYFNFTSTMTGSNFVYPGYPSPNTRYFFEGCYFPNDAYPTTTALDSQCLRFIDTSEYFTGQCKVSKETGSVRTGSMSVKISYRGIYNGSELPLSFSDVFHQNLGSIKPSNFNIWLSSGTSYNVGFYVMIGQTGSRSLPTNSSLFMHYSYIYDSGTTNHRTSVNSTETITETGTWTKMSADVHPAEDSWITASLMIYQPSGPYSYYLDPKPVIT